MKQGLGCRTVTRLSSVAGSPIEALEREMTWLGKSPTLTSGELEELVEVPIGNRRVLPLLALLDPGTDVRNEFQGDHVFPLSQSAPASSPRPTSMVTCTTSTRISEIAYRTCSSSRGRSTCRSR